MKTLTLCMVLIISLLTLNAQVFKMHVDSVPTNLKYDWKGEVFNLDFDLCIKNCPDSMLKVQPCMLVSFDSSKTKSEIRRAYRTGVQYYVPIDDNIKHNAGYDDTYASVWVNWEDQFVDTALRIALTWRMKIFQDSLLKPWKIILGEHIEFTPQQNIYNNDD